MMVLLSGFLYLFSMAGASPALYPLTFLDKPIHSKLHEEPSDEIVFGRYTTPTQTSFGQIEIIKWGNEIVIEGLSAFGDFYLPFEGVISMNKNGYEGEGFLLAEYNSGLRCEYEMKFWIYVEGETFFLKVFGPTSIYKSIPENTRICPDVPTGKVRVAKPYKLITES